MHICNIHILIPTPWTSPNAEAAKVYLASSLWIEIPYTSGSFDGNNGLDGSLEPLKAVLCSPPVKFLAGGEHSWFVSAWYADNCILCVFLTCRKISRWRAWDMNFSIQSSPDVVFLCDRNCWLFVTVVHFEGISWGLRHHRQGFPVVIVTVVRRSRPVAPLPEYTASGDGRPSAAGGLSHCGPSSRLTVAVFQEPGAVPSTKCTLSVKSLISVDSAPQNPDRVHEIGPFYGQSS